jgi:uridine kinase
MSFHNSLLFKKLKEFYVDDNLEKYLDYIKYNKISLRVIDWFVTNYSKKNDIIYHIYKSIDSKYSINPKDNYNYNSFNVYHSYKSQLKSYSKRNFDPFCRRNKINFDHPNTLDNELLIQQLHQLKNNQIIQMPFYDFKTHTRIKKTITKIPTKLIIIEGILIFENVELRNMMDIKIFVDTNADIRILRRIQRDISERGRDFQSVVDQYLSTVRPMHIEFVEPSKKYAHVIIPEGGQNKIGIDMIVSKIKQIID